MPSPNVRAHQPVGRPNLKPDQRLRDVDVQPRDTETLNVQANAFLQDPNTGLNSIQNEAFLIRVAQNAGRASLSAGLGSQQRIELTVASALRYRGEVTITSPGVMTPVSFTLPAGKSVEVYGVITDRRSFKGGSDSTRLDPEPGGSVPARDEQRSGCSRETQNGQGSGSRGPLHADQGRFSGLNCAGADAVLGCPARRRRHRSVPAASLLSLQRDWLLISSAFLTRQNITSVNGMAGTAVADPTITGLTGFARVAYRF
jgi:hypothetical protein